MYLDFKKSATQICKFYFQKYHFAFCILTIYFEGILEWLRLLFFKKKDFMSLFTVKCAVV